MLLLHLVMKSQILEKGEQKIIPVYVIIGKFTYLVISSKILYITERCNFLINFQAAIFTKAL